MEEWDSIMRHLTLCHPGMPFIKYLVLDQARFFTPPQKTSCRQGSRGLWDCFGLEKLMDPKGESRNVHSIACIFRLFPGILGWSATAIPIQTREDTQGVERVIVPVLRMRWIPKAGPPSEVLVCIRLRLEGTRYSAAGFGLVSHSK